MNGLLELFPTWFPSENVKAAFTAQMVDNNPAQGHEAENIKKGEAIIGRAR
jgi:hypothetical protein